MAANPKKTSIFSFVLVFFFGASNIVISNPEPLTKVLVSPVDVCEKGIRFEIPQHLGQIDEVITPARVQDLPGQAPFPCPRQLLPQIIHIQSAHGNYEAEKNIQALLRYFHETYASEALFLEGGVGKLHPEVFNLFPSRNDLNLKVANALAKRAEMSGPELFLIENMAQGKRERPQTINQTVTAYGIEDAKAYRWNREAFQEVLKQKEKTEHFLQDMNLQIVRLSSAYLNADLRGFLKTLEDYDTKKTGLVTFLEILKREARKRVEINLDAPYSQKDWPMLARFLQLQKLEPNPDPAIMERIKAFHSELRGGVFFEELSQLRAKLLEQLARTEKEKEVLVLLKDYDLLKKLFSLELNRSDFEAIERRSIPFLDTASLKPSKIAERFLRLNDERRVKHIEFKHLDDLDRLYELALSFYKGAEERESFMAKNILGRIKRFGKKPIILVTGGFHSQVMKESFVSRGFSYCLITPKINQITDNHAYHISMLEIDKSSFAVSQIANIVKLEFIQRILQQGADPAYIQLQMGRALREAEIKAVNLAWADSKVFLEQYSLEIKPSARNEIIRPSRDFHFLRIKKKMARSEVRASAAHISRAQFEEIRAMIRRAPKQANESILIAILDGLKDNDRIFREQALLTLQELLNANPTLRNSENYLSRKEDIKNALADYLGFIKSMQRNVPRVPWNELVRLEANILSLEGLKESGLSTLSIPAMVDWTFQNRTGSNSEHFVIFVNHDTGSFLSQVERGRFVALFLYLANSVREPSFFTLHPISPSPDPNQAHGHFFQRYKFGTERKLSYLFRLSSGAVETEETLQEENFKVRIQQRLEEVQWLNLGLFLASAEDSYKVFFPGETPFWVDEKMKRMAQVYRAFERRLVSFLREYNQFRNRNNIKIVPGDSLDIHQERQKAFDKYQLEEPLFNLHSWLYPVKDSQDTLLPLLRVYEAMERQDETGKTPANIDLNLSIGREFMERIQEIGDEFWKASKKILSDEQSLSSREFTPQFLEAFNDAGKFFDPFIDTKTQEAKKATLYYLEKIVDGLSQGLIFPTELPVPSFNYQTAYEVLRQELEQTGRSEVRSDSRVRETFRLLLKQRQEIEGQLQPLNTIFGNEKSHVEAVAGAVRILAIGDVHGDLNGLVQHLATVYGLSDAEEKDVLEKLGDLKDKNFPARQSIYDQIIEKLDIRKGHVIAFAGDYVDKGSQSVETVEFVIRLKSYAPKVGARVLTEMGNHDYYLKMLLKANEGKDPSQINPSTVRNFYLTYGSYRIMQEKGILDFFDNLKQLILIDNNILVHGNILDLLRPGVPTAGEIHNIEELDKAYALLTSRQADLLGAPSGKELLEKAFLNPTLLDTWEYLSDWALPLKEGSETAREFHEVYVKRQQENRARLYEIVANTTGMKPNRLLVGHDPSLKSVGRIEYHPSQDVFHLDGGLSAYYRNKGTTPGILEISAAGDLGVHQPLSEGAKWKNLLKPGELPEFVLRGENAEIARKADLLKIDKEIRRIRSIIGLEQRAVDDQSREESKKDNIRSEIRKETFLTQIIKAEDEAFGVAMMPVPGAFSLHELARILREFQPLLKNYPKRVLILTYPGKVPERLRNMFYEKFDERVFIFEGNHEEILKGLYSSGADLSKWSEQDREWAAKHFLPRANQLLGQTAKPGILSRSSFAVGSKALFNEMGMAPAKQLLDQRVDGITADQLLRAYLLFSLSYAATPNAVLLKEAPGDLFKFEPQSSDDLLRFSLNASKALEIQALVRAAQHLLKSA